MSSAEVPMQSRCSVQHDVNEAGPLKIFYMCSLCIPIEGGEECTNEICN